MPRPTILLGLALCACTAAPVVQPLPPATLLVDLGPDEFPGARGLLAGFDAPTDGADWVSDDRVLLGLRLKKGEETRRWMLLLDVAMAPEPMRSSFRRLLAKATTEEERAFARRSLAAWEDNFPIGSWPYWITTAEGRRDRELRVSSILLMVSTKVYDADGRLLDKSLVHLPAELLSHGVLAAADRAMAHAAAVAAAGPEGLPAAAVSEAAVRPQVEAILGMMSLLRVVQEDDVLAQYFWQVIEKPSLWSVLTSLGVSANLSMGFERSVEAEVLPPHLPARGRAVVVPMRIDVNGSPALFVDLLATDPARPYALCGGLIAAAAHHPTDPDLHFDVVLLAARLAKPK